MRHAPGAWASVRVWDRLFESGHCRRLLTKVRQRACNAADISLVQVVSARRDAVADLRNLGRIVTVVSGYRFPDRASYVSVFVQEFDVAYRRGQQTNAKRA